MRVDPKDSNAWWSLRRACRRLNEVFDDGVNNCYDTNVAHLELRFFPRGQAGLYNGDEARGRTWRISGTSRYIRDENVPLLQEKQNHSSLYHDPAIFQKIHSTIAIWSRGQGVHSSERVSP